MTTLRERFCAALKSVVGTPYRWGGQSPEHGFDCSGLIIWALREAGMPVADMPAAGLARLFHHNKKLIGLAEAGDLLFYGPDVDNITHVMAVINRWTTSLPDTGWPLMCLVGARGGTSDTIGMTVAYEQGAFVDVVRGDYWRSAYQFVRGID